MSATTDITTTNAKYAMKSVCVFCGSKTGNRPEYVEGTKALANEMLKRNIGLVYGGGNIGLMGVVSSSIVEGGGEVLGIIPKSLAPREVSGVMTGGKSIIVETMHDRKLIMYKEADGFIAIPGGYGTLDELMEIVTWSQLGIHSKPIGLLNIAGYFDPLLEWVNKATNEGFVSEKDRNIWIVASDPVELLDKFEAFVPRAPMFNWDIKV